MCAQVPQFILEAADEDGQLHNTKIVAAQPRRLITTGKAWKTTLSAGRKNTTFDSFRLHSNEYLDVRVLLLHLAHEPSYCDGAAARA